MARLATIVCSVIAVLGVGSLTLAQDRATPTADEDLAAEVHALSTQVANLSTRVARLEGQRGGRSTGPASTATVTEATKPPVATEPVQMGEEAQVEGWTIRATATEVRDQFIGEPPVLPRGMFVVVWTEITNSTTAPAAFPYRDIRLIDSKGREFAPNFDATWSIQYYESGSLLNEDLQPGLVYVYPLVFDVAADATGFVLSSGKHVFAIQLDR